MTSSTLIIKPTKKAFRELLNVWYADLKWKHNRFHNRVRAYGDYLYAQDIDMFNENFGRWIKAGCPTDQYSFEKA